MSQEQPRRAPEDTVKYGDIFAIGGELAEEPVMPRDAAMMQTAESEMFGQIQKGRAAAAMQSAAARNERAGLVGHSDMTEVAGKDGVTITETDLPGQRVITESVGRQVVNQYSRRSPIPTMTPSSIYQTDASKDGVGPITIGEALEAAALTAGQKPVEWSDAAAIQAAEVRATGRTAIVPGGVAAAAQSAANLNARTPRAEDKTTLADILGDATSKLPSDKPASRRDAEGVASAEMRNDPNLNTHPAGIAASVAAAARLNQKK
ncbi:late embryogenesis abundant protein D-34-like isoform X2 [Syzygium oleosum]|uniref:late embryogenesis abundant protein D-34-like isoform X2 n=1 Tax=Syzygium oleosum TaxID=219896 RepID=UPI0011D1F277|nr:late embryogenesis abundant protein D-34-like isoform X2 [Syzygium oleosum]